MSLLTAPRSHLGGRRWSPGSALLVTLYLLAAAVALARADVLTRALGAALLVMLAVRVGASRSRRTGP